jgi:hypothetical protein
MCEIVFALYDIIPEDDNKIVRIFAAFLSVYMILLRMRFTENDLSELQVALQKFHGFA